MHACKPCVALGYNVLHCISVFFMFREETLMGKKIVS
jgi:hypothetical protein